VPEHLAHLVNAAFQPEAEGDIAVRSHSEQRTSRTTFSTSIDPAKVLLYDRGVLEIETLRNAGRGSPPALVAVQPISGAEYRLPCQRRPR
jgi:hypothetical protein